MSKPRGREEIRAHLSALLREAAQAAKPPRKRRVVRKPASGSIEIRQPGYGRIVITIDQEREE